MTRPGPSAVLALTLFALLAVTARPMPARRRGGVTILRAVVLALALAVPLPCATPASADVVYLYDELSRLVRVIRDDGEAATYHYDAVGNILRITRGSGIPQTSVVSSTSTAVAGRGSRVTVTVSGHNLVAARLSTPVSGVTFENVRTDLDQVTVDVVVADDTPLGTTTLELQTDLATASVAFTIAPGPPVVTSFTPAFGAAGTSVTIQGNQFDERSTANNQVSFNGVPSTVTAVTRTSLTAVAPAGATSGPITVSNGVATASSSQSFITGQVVADSVTPASAERGATVSLRISGTNLLGGQPFRAGITFSAVTATADQLTADAAILLAAPQEGVITVSNGVTLAAVPFTVLPGAPAITSFAPGDGAPGDTVTINGRGFDELVTANNVVRFNGVQAELVSVDPVRIVARVPTGAATGRITVTTPAGKATSATDFTITTGGLRLAGTIAPPFGAPTRVVLGLDRRRAYVLNGSRDSVSVVDTTTHTVTATVPVGDFPVHAAVSPDGARLYVLSEGLPGSPNAAVTVIDLASNAALATIPLTAASAGRIAVSSDAATLVVSHPTDNRVSLLDTATSVIVAFVTVDRGPTDVVASPTAPRAFVVNRDSNTVSIFDTASRSLVTTVAVGSRPMQGIFTPDGRRYYVSNAFSSSVSAIDPSTNAVTTIAAGGGPLVLAVSPDGTRLYVGVESHSSVTGPAISIVDTSGNTVLGAIATGESTQNGFTVTPDGLSLVVSFDRTSSAAIIDTVARAVVAVVPLNGVGCGVPVAPADQLVYAMCQTSSTLAIVDVAARALVDAPISRTGAPSRGLLAFTPGGGRAYGKAGFIRELVATFDPATREARANIVPPTAPSRLLPRVNTVSLDPATGGMLYVQTDRQVVFVDTATDARLAVRDLVFGAGTAAFVSPDGSRLYLVRGTTLETFETATRTALPAFVFSGVFFRDAVMNAAGTRIYVAGEASPDRVVVLDPAARTVVATVLLPAGSQPFRLAFTADGRKLLVMNRLSRTISVIDTETHAIVATLSPGGSSYNDLAASPTAARAYLANGGGLRVDVIDTETHTIVGSVPLSAAPTAIAVSPDGRRMLAVQDTTGVVSALDTASNTLAGSLAVAPPSSSLGRPVFGPDGRAYLPSFGLESVLVLE